MLADFAKTYNYLAIRQPEDEPFGCVHEGNDCKETFANAEDMLYHVSKKHSDLRGQVVLFVEAAWMQDDENLHWLKLENQLPLRMVPKVRLLLHYMSSACTFATLQYTKYSISTSLCIDRIGEEALSQCTLC